MRIDPAAAPSLGELADSTERAFQLRFGRAPEVLVAAPGRVNLIGEHIDYNDGFVMPMAIERFVVMAAARRQDPAAREATFHSLSMDHSVTFQLGGWTEPRTSGWARYVEGVTAGWIQRGGELPALDAAFQSSVPLGGGLSSSAALEVATATVLEAVSGCALDPVEKALLCQRAEHRFAGVPCGIMDQFSSVLGKPNELMLIDCQSQQVRPVPFAAAGITLLITNSNVKHELAGGEYSQRRAQCDAALAKLQRSSWRDVSREDVERQRPKLTSQEYRRGRHVVGEIARTLAAAEAFQAADWSKVGQLMYESHQSLRDDYEVSCDELDTLVAICRDLGPAAGVLGSRMTGGGFGGCTVSLVRSDAVASVMASVTEQYQARTGIRPDCFASRPARGAHRLGRVA
jgi:galactokinase